MPDLTTHYHGRYLALVERNGWEYTTRTNASGVAVIVPLTRLGELILVEQFRIPVGRPTLELPAGLAGDHEHHGEDLADAAARELEEETGFRAGRLTLMLEAPSSAGLTDEMITFFLAEDLQKTGAGGGDASEDIKVHKVPLEDAEAWLAQRQAQGIYLDPKIFTGLYWLSNPAWRQLIAPATTG